VSDTVWLRRGALAAIAAMAGLSYGWALGRVPLEPYYAAAVRSMSMSWHDFAFGAFDPAGTITLDKLPGAFWVQALAVRALGFHTWVILAPQAVEGVLTVLVLYRAVRRLAGSGAGLIAALILAVSPATVALNRGNISDSLMILLLVLAADAVSGAITSASGGSRGSQGRLILAGVCVALAFQAKMIEAWLLLPALGLAYLLAGPGPASRRIRQLAVTGVITGVVSLSWMTAVSVVPAAHRPAIDGSQHNSVYEQVFVYNGFGRLGDHNPLQLLAGQSLGIGIPATPAAGGPGLLLQGDLGRDTGWLLPAAVIAAAWGIASRRRRPRGDGLRACLVLWGGWLATLGVTFTVTSAIHAYYTAALTPAVAALLGAGITAMWSAERSAVARRIGLAVVAAGTVAYARWLLPASGTHLPGWLVPVLITAGVAATATILGSVAIRSDRLWAGALAAGLAAGLLAPAVAAAELVNHHQGAFDTPFEPPGAARVIDSTFLQAPAQVKLIVGQLESVQNGAPYLLATQTSALASVFITASGRETLPIGGFTGTIPYPTLDQLRADIRAWRFHLVLAGASTDPRLKWIAAHCQHAGNAAGNLRNYYCVPADAG
jgi:4-amino-4-deoxy-L-arabinose transferase-like glycosyltransferase